MKRMRTFIPSGTIVWLILSVILITAVALLRGEFSIRFFQRDADGSWGVSNFLRSFATSGTETLHSPVPLSPATGTSITPNSLIEFQWDTTANANHYHFELLSSSSAASEPLAKVVVDANACANNICTLPSLFNFSTYGQVIWRVSASNEAGNSDWASAEVLSLPPIPAAPRKIDFTANTNLDAGSAATFNWQRDSLADTYDFHIIDPTTPEQWLNQLTDLVLEDICTASHCSLRVTLDFPVNSGYLWRITAKNAAGASDWSATTFNIVELIPEPPPTPTPISPLPKALLEQKSRINFSWSASETANLYKLQLINTRNSDLSAATAFVPAKNCADNKCSVSITLDLPIGDFYEWRALAKNTAGESAWSTTAMEIIANASEKPPPMRKSPISGREQSTILSK